MSREKSFASAKRLFILSSRLLEQPGSRNGCALVAGRLGGLTDFRLRKETGGSGESGGDFDEEFAAFELDAVQLLQEERDARLLYVDERFGRWRTNARDGLE